eukprot:402694-Amphidinium_carterae.1
MVPGAHPPVASWEIWPCAACPSLNTAPSMTGFLARPKSAKSSQRDAPSGSWEAPSLRSPQQPMAILRQSKYLSTGESRRQYLLPAFSGP